MSMGKAASFQVHGDPKLKASASVDIDLLAVRIVFLAADILINKAIPAALLLPGAAAAAQYSIFLMCTQVLDH